MNADQPNLHPGVLLITDLDKTLLDEHARVPEICLRRIAEFVGEGGLFSVATGRPPRGVLLFPRLAQYICTPIIAYNGACLYDGRRRRPLWEKVFSHEQTCRLRKVIRCFPTVGAVIYYGPGDDAVTVRENAGTVELTQRREAYRAPLGEAEAVPEPWKKVTFCGGPEEDVRSCAEAVRVALEQAVTLIVCEGTYVDVLPPALSKGDALVRLAKQEGLELRNIISVGDSQNDYEMIARVPNGVAVANAEPAVRAAAAYVVASNREFGVARCVEQIALPLLRARREELRQGRA
jgi:Cof subfamily protein (haloacid dehalogenase superfamily)